MALVVIPALTRCYNTNLITLATPSSCLDPCLLSGAPNPNSTAPVGPPQVRNRSRVDDPQAVACPHQALPAPSWCRFITAGRRKSSFSAINTTTDRPGRRQKSSSPPRLRRHEALRITRPLSRQRPPHLRDTAPRSRAVTLGPRQASLKNRTRQSAAPASRSSSRATYRRRPTRLRGAGSTPGAGWPRASAPRKSRS